MPMRLRPCEAVDCERMFRPRHDTKDPLCRVYCHPCRRALRTKTEEELLALARQKIESREVKQAATDSQRLLQTELAEARRDLREAQAALADVEPSLAELQTTRSRLAELELARKDRDAYRMQLRAEAERVEKLEAQLELFGKLSGYKPKIPKWLTPKKTKPGEAMANLLSSDQHLGEVVNPDEIGGCNAYNRRIAEFRLQRCFERTVRIFRDYLGGLKFRGCNVLLAGDTLSGHIHDELLQSNESTVIDEVQYWVPHFGAGIQMLADEFGHVHVPAVPGNHGRNTRKPRAKFRAKDNFDWLFAHLLQASLANDSRITWQIPESADTIVQVYDHRYLLTHGDQFRGGSGIAGLFTPLIKGVWKKRQRQQAIGEPFDMLVCGHWHSYTTAPNFLINGSLKGYDEYAFTENFDYEPPQQAAFAVTPEHGACFHVPVLCSDPKAEGWG